MAKYRPVVLPIIAQLKTIRRHRRLSQRALAAIMGYERTTVSKGEIGEHCSSIATVTDWANALGYELVLRAKE